MKRSEAIARLTNFLSFLEYPDQSYNDDARTDRADKIIDYLESNGIMHPPVNEGRSKVEEAEDGSLIITLLKWEE
jgi:hypothetical protein